jgi:hypothetical protein
MYYVNQEGDVGLRIGTAEIEENAGGLRVLRVGVAGVNTGNLKDLAVPTDGRDARPRNRPATR